MNKYDYIMIALTAVYIVFSYFLFTNGDGFKQFIGLTVLYWLSAFTLGWVRDKNWWR